MGRSSFQKSQSNADLWCIVGDFNSVRRANERRDEGQDMEGVKEKNSTNSLRT